MDPQSKHKKRKNLSLRALLEDIKKHPEYVAYSDVRRRMVGRGLDERASKDLFYKIAGRRDHAGRRALTRDIAELERTTKQVKQFTNKNVAHTELDRRRRRPTTYGQLQKSVASIERIWSRWSLLLIGETASDRLLDESGSYIRDLLDRLWLPHK